jgi:hypothetical protein
MESIDCVICGKQSQSPFETVFDRLGENENTFHLVRCNCGFVFLNPRPTQTEIQNYYNVPDYDPHHEKQGNVWDSVYKFVQTVTLKWKYRKILPFEELGFLLDIGGGQGEFANYMAEKNWYVYFQDDHSTIKRTLISNTIQSYRHVKQIPDDVEFSVITLWHSLEHIHDVDFVFTYISEKLVEGGVAAIAVPNLNAPERKIFRSAWAPYDAPRHLYHFNLQSLEDICEKYKLTVIRKYSMFQDAPYNILLSLTPLNPIKLIKAFFITLYAWIYTAIRGPKYSSSILLLCQKQ